MPKKKTTIRKMRGLPLSRKYWHLLGDLHSIALRLEHLGEEIEMAESDAKALRSRMPRRKEKK